MRERCVMFAVMSVPVMLVRVHVYNVTIVILGA